jgi:hypothetical protein
VVEFEVLSPTEKRQLVSRIAESHLFRRAPRVREFFLYVADCSIENRLEGVREQAIAENVFHRDSGNYEQDSIVRAEARNLRRRLEQYFETEGKDEAIAVLMPKGGYSLSFERRSSRAPAKTEGMHAAGRSTPLSRVSSEPDKGQKTTGPVRFYRIACAALAILFLGVTALAIHWRPSRPPATSPAVSARRSLPFSVLFDNLRDTYIVTSDTSVLQILILSGQRISVNDYIVRSYPPIRDTSRPVLTDMLNRFNNTNSDEMAIAGEIMSRNALFLQRTFLRSGHQVQLADFKGRNIILIGSPLSNPWAQLYADRLNFQFDWDPQRAITFHNRSPRASELPEYPAPGDDHHHWSYAHLVFLPDVDTPGSVLLIAGTTLGATAAAGEFLLDQAHLERELKTAGIDPAGPPHYFELLLRATTFTGGATQSEVIARRSEPK